MLTGARSPLVVSHPLDRDRWAGLVRGPGTDVPFPVTRARLTGFREAFEESGRGWADAPVAVVARHTRDDGRRAVATALDEVRPDVVITMSDQLAAGALDVLGPSVRVSGWDDSDLAAELGFSSVRQSLFDQGVACAGIAAGLTATADPVPWQLSLRPAGPGAP
jgi:DNA-binding LacI/PurR family transcriptional regulator